MAQQVNIGQGLGTTFTAQQITQLERESRRENLGRSWYKFSRNALSVVGAATVLLLVLLAVLLLT